MARSFESRRFPRGNYRLQAGFVLTGAALLARSVLAQERYSAAPPANPPAAGQPASVGGAPGPGAGNLQSLPNSDGSAPASRSPLGAVSPPAGNTSGSAAASSGGATSAYGRSPAPDGSPPRTMPPTGSNPQAISGFGQSPSAPSNYQRPPAGTSNGAMLGTGLKPSAMMRAMLSPSAGSQLRGQPTSLQDVVTGAIGRSEQTLRVEAYWDLCSGVADYYLGLREQEELRRLRTLVQSVGPTWAQAESDLNIRVGTSRQAALASQFRLASLIGRGSSNLPLPADSPHCASYDTQFERIFPAGGPAEARELAAVLPARYAELKGAAAAVTRGEQWVENVALGDHDGTGTLRALELLALQRRAFVQIARDYNRRIARYSELAAPGQLSPVRLTSMLIYTTASSTATRSLLSTPPRNRQSSTTPSPPPTFIESSASAMQPISTAPLVGSDVQPASADQNSLDSKPAADGERSLLVPPEQ